MQRVKSHHSHHSHHSNHSHHSHHSGHRHSHISHHSHHSHRYPEDQIDEAVGSIKGHAPGRGGKVHRVIRQSGGEHLGQNFLTVATFDEDDDDYDDRLDLDDPGIVGGDDGLRPGDALFKALANFVPPLPPIIGCPVGLEHLYFANMIIINQSVEGAEINMGYETSNRYDVINSDGQRIYLAIEVSHDCQLFCFGAGRPFQIKLYDYTGREVMSLWRACTCLFCLGEVCGCTKFGSAVHAKLTHPEETRDLGIVRQTPLRCSQPIYILHSSDGSPKYQIIGPNSLCLGCEHDNPKFEVFKAGTKTDPVGQIQRIYAGYTREFFTDADLFKLDFPESDTGEKIDTADKALLLAAVFLIDFLHFEDQCGRGSILRNNRCRLAILVFSIIALAVIIFEVFDNLK